MLSLKNRVAIITGSDISEVWISCITMPQMSDRKPMAVTQG